MTQPTPKQIRRYERWRKGQADIEAFRSACANLRDEIIKAWRLNEILDWLSGKLK